MDRSEVLDLCATANELVRTGGFDAALQHYTSAIRLARGAGDAEGHQLEASCLALRSSTYLTLSKLYRRRSAELSERGALYGQDPVILIKLAAKDAKRVTELQPDSREAWLNLGCALQAQEQFDQAENAWLEGLTVAPSDEELLNALQSLQRQQDADEAQVLHHVEALQGAGGASSAPPDRGTSTTPLPTGGASDATAGTLTTQKSAAFKRRRLHKMTDDMDCVLCSELLHEPTTLPCGHTFCRHCIARCLDHSTKCPMCRAVLHVGAEFPVTTTLKNILLHSFPEEYAARVRRLAADTASPSVVVQPRPPLPLFVMSLTLPGEAMSLNIFEPRYRLMVRRCLEGNRKFGMAMALQTPSGHELFPIATECEIVEAETQPDGRFYLEVRGGRRFRIPSTWELDGYRMCKPVYFEDDEVQTAEAQRVLEQALQLDKLVKGFLDHMKTLHRRAFTVLSQKAGPCPDAATRPEAFSFWCCTAVPLDDGMKTEMMEMTSTLQRLQVLNTRIAASLQGRSCNIM